MKNYRNHKRRHYKISGYVDFVRDGKWHARLFLPGPNPDYPNEYSAEMKDPLPVGMKTGNFFTLHTTKRGEQYFYWPRKPPMTNRQRKKELQEQRRWSAIWLTPRQPVLPLDFRNTHDHSHS